MLRKIRDRIWAFDLEWVPDPVAGRLLYEVPDTVTDPAEVMRVMWERAGASEEDPKPYLKTVVCRIVSIAALERRVERGGEVTLRLLRLPYDATDSEQTREAHIVGTFLAALGRDRPQLVGYNSLDADLRILLQRGVLLGLRAADPAARTGQPGRQEQGADYFSRTADRSVDLRTILGGRGRGVPSLHELAVQSGVPGKLGIDGSQVAAMWLQGRLPEIVDYNEFDALTTYLLWLRVAHFAGRFSSEEYALEQQRLRDLLEAERKHADRAHLGRYLEEWERLTRALEALRG